MAAATAATVIFYPNSGKKASKTTVKFHVCPPFPYASPKLSPTPFLRTHERFLFRPLSSEAGSAVAGVESGEAIGDEEEENRRKVYVVNLPWNCSASDIEDLFRLYGTVEDVDIVKHRDGRSKGYAFVTMDTPEEAQAAIEKLDSFELTGRIIRVELAKRFKKPSWPKQPPSTTASLGETRHKIYVGNLARKVRAGNLKEFFSTKFNPLSARVVFENNSSGKSTGYGFVSFATKEEVESVVSELEGKGRRSCSDELVRFVEAARGTAKPCAEL
ncbi:31 kDa ribonucleoprotein, chloroplastic [Apostasia shenzhenica]|uniref:31 kDa ribonucleoprotein, chloroplastic n=1 Tax=Apostasia shenzhenica TaxID=1088818 RepID=A0A2I0AWV7_9ASPA|nr:31 kDa ribonucleoprotein, chloroplastic [Apostasia shenzhenica]